MDDPATVLFLTVYRQTDSVDAAILELKRLGWDQQHTARVIVQLFAVGQDLAEETVKNSVAWQ